MRGGLTVPGRALALVLVALVIGACARNTATIVLVNETKEPIASATVEVGGPIVELGQIEPGGRATGRLAVGGDADYHITVRFQSGAVLDRRLGYVTSGMDFHDEFSVSETDIVLKSAKVN
jgi:hypothetical protein